MVTPFTSNIMWNSFFIPHPHLTVIRSCSRARLKRDGTRAETRFGLSAKRTSPFKLAGGGAQFRRLLAAEVCASAVVMAVMLDTPCSEVECKTYWLLTPLACFPFTSPTVRHRVPSGFNWTLQNWHPNNDLRNSCHWPYTKSHTARAVSATYVIYWVNQSALGW